MQISEHITYEEAIKSQTAIRLKIDNTPTDEEIEAMKIVANECFEKLRAWYGKPLLVSSFYRCKKLNTAIGGSLTSQHVKGEAIDIDTGNKAENKKLYEYAKLHLIFDQLIYEYGDDTGPEWVHISFTAKKTNRQQTLRV